MASFQLLKEQKDEKNPKAAAKLSAPKKKNNQINEKRVNQLKFPDEEIVQSTSTYDVKSQEKTLLKIDRRGSDRLDFHNSHVKMVVQDLHDLRQH